MSEFYSFAGDNTLYVTGEIASGSSWWDDVTAANNFRYSLNRCNGDVTVWIDSPGGDAFAGAAIYEALREYSESGRGRVIANVTLAASAASIIAMAADEVRISVMGTIMIHDPWSVLAGNARELRATADTLDEIREGQIRAYMRKCKKTYDEVLALMRGSDGNGTYMNAKTSVDNGFADSILHDEGGDWVQSAAKMRVMSCMRDDSERLAAAIRAHESTPEEAKGPGTAEPGADAKAPATKPMTDAQRAFYMAIFHK